MEQDVLTSEQLDEEWIHALRVIALEEKEPPLGMLSRMEAGIARPARLSGQASAVAASVAFIVCSFAYTTLFGIDLTGALALASLCGGYGVSLRWLLEPVA